VKNCSKPFPHVIIDDYLPADVVAQINREWPADDHWLKKEGRTSIKWSTQDVPPAARAVIDAVDIAMIEQLTGIKGLIPDPDLFGAGLHCIPAGGFLKMHVDFNQHPKGWMRRINMLIYLNEYWEDSWGGHLQLGIDDLKLIAPIGGRCVIFETNERSWHGHPIPMACPVNVQRRSMALYFYTPDPPVAEVHTTIYQRGEE
jgi:hypothetical protein